MTGDVLNLRQFRKQKARADKEKQADQNRISFGRTKVEKTLTRSLNDIADRRLDQGRLEKARLEQGRLEQGQPDRSSDASDLAPTETTPRAADDDA